MEEWMKEFYDAYEGLKIEFEDIVNFEDETPKERREDRLDAIIYYAEAHDMPEVVKHARSAKSTDEDILSILAIIGFTFDGKNIQPITQDKSNTQKTYSNKATQTSLVALRAGTQKK
ncbi:MAG: hypothetical protein LBP19_09510 [Treponema sp.]|jgi:hypothetical protein|nr:hypothetical protein [Treponema sp.]